MAVSEASLRRPITRRKFLRNSIIAAAGLAVHAGEIERHYIEVTRHNVAIAGLPHEFDGATIAQLSDIHLDEYTEPIFLEHAVNLVNNLSPDYVFLTGDYVTDGVAPQKFAEGEAWQCANVFTRLKCRQRFAILGNHDVKVGANLVRTAFNDNGIPVLANACMPIERGNARLWLAGMDDAAEGDPHISLAIPERIRGIADEPVILLCHEPDYVDNIIKKPAGQAVSLMLSGHTHGGQVRLPLIGPLTLPDLGKNYVEGWFRFGNLQLYVNRGLGTVGVPFRFDCPPEISVFTLRRAEAAA